MASRRPSHAPEKPRTWHAWSADEALVELSADIEAGLSQHEAEKRLEQHGKNSLPEPEKRGAWRRLIAQFKNPLIYVLVAAGAVTFAIGHFTDAWVIIGVVLVNAVIGFIQEGKAEKALEAVRSMQARRSTVRRDGERREIEAELLVPGDIVLLESGDRVPADVRLVRVKNLSVDEAALTGESVAVDKNADPVEEDAPIGDRFCMAYSGTTVGSGQAQGVVVGTGQETEIGRINRMAGEVESLDTPLTRRLEQFARRITLLILAVGLIAFLYGHFVSGMPLQQIFLAVVGLVVSAIPEGLPAIVTIVLAIGTRVMADNNALVRRLPAVETLGSVTVICSDKTGTLTKNEMTATRVLLPALTVDVSGIGYAPDGGFSLDGEPLDPASDEALRNLARCGLLCNDAHLKLDGESGWQLAGDPTEGALLTLAYKAGLDPKEEAEATPRIDEIPFESEHRFMATLHHDRDGRAFMLLKGAPERVLDLCERDAGGQGFDEQAWKERMDEAARDGLRVLALAQCDMPDGTSSISMDDINRRFTLLGLAGLIDPPREEAIAAVADCRKAGVDVKMITGDHAVTASAIGRQLGLESETALTGQEVEKMSDEELQRRVMENDVIARASPEHKIRLVKALQDQGELVAMTGDGVNDAPAVRAANIGIAMGLKGTDAARESADLVLTDDNFATIARAVRQGRVVFDNIKKSLAFILPTNAGESGLILLAVFGGFTLPITAVQILWINMVTTVTLALALAFEPAERDVMERPPRPPSEPIITRVMALRIAFVGLLMVVTAMIVFTWERGRGGSIEMARTAVVNMLAVAELFYLFNVRHFTTSAFTRDMLTGNRFVLWMSALLIVLQLVFTYVPLMQGLFHSEPLDAMSWLVIAGLGIAMFLAVEAEKAVLRRMNIRSM